LSGQIYKDKSAPIMYAAGIIVFLLVWQILSFHFNNEILLPSPLAVFKKLILLAGEKKFITALGASFLRVVFALLVSVPSGIAVGILSALNKKIDFFMRPFFNLVAATPVMAIILIVFLWLGAEITPVFTAFLMVFPIMAANTMQAIKNVNPEHLELFAVFEMNNSEKLKYLYIPELLPYLSAALRSCLSLTWKVVVAAEVLVQPAFAIGRGMQSAKANLETTELFAWTISSVIAAGICEAALLFFNRRHNRRYNRHHKK
jgi:NitT/TauT family transport system permease protein